MKATRETTGHGKFAYFSERDIWENVVNRCYWKLVFTVFQCRAEVVWLLLKMSLTPLCFLFYWSPYSPAVCSFSHFSRYHYVHVNMDTRRHALTYTAIYLHLRRETAFVARICYLLSLMRLLPDNYTPATPIAKVCGVSTEFIGQVTSGQYVIYTPHTQGKQARTFLLIDNQIQIILSVANRDSIWTVSHSDLHSRSTPSSS